MTTEPQPTPALEAAARRRRELREALVAFEGALSSPRRDVETWRRAVVERLDGLQSAFAEHVLETEQPGGLYDEMALLAPHVSPRARRLREEHPRVSAALDEAKGRLEAGLPADADVDAIRDDLQRLMGRIVRHRQGGADLVWEAYAVDIGAAG
jgi:hypothetical protein